MKQPAISLLLIFTLAFCSNASVLAERQQIKAVGIPLADHYAGIVAYEKYRDQMQYADYQLMILPDPELVRAYFRSEPDADLAYTVSPMAMDMFLEKPDFRWVSLIHRDGNALVVNRYISERANLAQHRKDRMPDSRVADAISSLKQETGQPVEIAIPSTLATHTTILYKYLKSQNRSFTLNKENDADVLLTKVKPPLSPLYLKKKAMRSMAAATEQSLPWPEVIEHQGYGRIGWYSKDVMSHEHGHVECIILAQDRVIEHKRQALKEVIYYIHQAGRDIEHARRKGGKDMLQIVKMIRKHIPAHTPAAIMQSLRADLNVINYLHLNVDENAKASFREIMNLAVEAGFVSRNINIEELADESFSSDLTNQPLEDL